MKNLQVLALAAIFVLSAGPAISQTCTLTIDFDNNACNGGSSCTAGDIVSSVTADVSGLDAACTGLSSEILIEGIDPNFIPADTNLAMIFDSDCGGTNNPANCSGGDPLNGDDADLGTPNEAYGGPGLGDDGATNDSQQFNVLIISEDGNGANPDDTGDPDTKTRFYFGGITAPFTPDLVQVTSITTIDKEADEGTGDVKLWAPGLDFTSDPPSQNAPLPPTGDNGKIVHLLEAGSPEYYMEIDLNGSGAIDDIVLTIFKEELGDDGCTPGFWKGHDGSLKPNGKPRPDAWTVTGLAVTDTLDSQFTIPAEYDAGFAITTLRAALSFGGGPGLDGAAKILFRAAVAAILNAEHPDVDYSSSSAAIRLAVNEALASLDRATILTLAGEIDWENNEGCPINGKEYDSNFDREKTKTKQRNGR